MESKTVLVNRNLKRSLTIGGVGVFVLGISYYFFRRSKRKSYMPKELVIKMLRELRKAYFPILKQIENTAVGIADYYGLKSLSYEQKAEVVASSNHAFGSL